MYRVLLVDDEILIRNAIRENIDWTQLDYELVGDCENGKEAIAFVEEMHVDLVLTDICMPYVDGMQLCKYLYENHPETAIIVFSGFGEFEYAQKAIQYKVSEFLLKPITAVELSEVLVRLHDKLSVKRQREAQIDDLIQTKKRYKKNELVIVSKTLSYLVMGTKKAEDCLQELEEMGIRLQATHYRVVAIDIDLYSNLYGTDETEKIEKTESALMSFAVGNICQEIMEQCHCGLVYQDDSNCNFMILQTNQPVSFLKQAKELCTKIQKSIYDMLKLRVSIGMGQYVSSLDELHLSYDSAVETLNYRYTLGEGILMDRENQELLLNGYVDIDKEINELMTDIKNAESEHIHLVFEMIMQKFRKEIVGRTKISLCLQQILGSITEVILDMEGKEPVHINRRNEVYDEIVNGRTCEIALGAVEQYAYEACDIVNKAGHSSGQRQAMKAIDYMKANYADSNLNLNDVCGYLGISTSYFSNIFKETTGNTFMETLIQMRMQKAKELLEQTTLKNYEIAERVGFSDPHYFSIAFKKATGQSPKEYAKGDHDSEETGGYN